MTKRTKGQSAQGDSKFSAAWAEFLRADAEYEAAAAANTSGDFFEVMEAPLGRRNGAMMNVIDTPAGSLNDMASKLWVMLDFHRHGTPAFASEEEFFDLIAAETAQFIELPATGK